MVAKLNRSPRVCPLSLRSCLVRESVEAALWQRINANESSYDDAALSYSALLSTLDSIRAPCLSLGIFAFYLRFACAEQSEKGGGVETHLCLRFA